MEVSGSNFNDLLKGSFDPAIIFQGQKMVEQGRVSLSFVKGSLEGFFIVSGIVSENNTSYEAKVSFKKSEEEDKGRLTTKLLV